MLISAKSGIASRFISAFSVATIAVMATAILSAPSLVGDANAGQRSTSVYGAGSKVHQANSNHLFIQRQRSINRYNDRLVLRNHLQAKRRAGAVLSNPRYSKVGGVVIAHPDYGKRHSGVVLRKNKKTQLFTQRQRFLDRHNDRLVLKNYLQSERRSNAVLANPKYRYGGDVLIYDGQAGAVVSTGGEVTETRYGTYQACPKSYNCGYRVYSNGSGPRIITPGVPAGNGLPAHDGFSGPSIITLD